MKKTLLIVAFACFSTLAIAQSISDIRKEQLSTQKKGMLFLGSWAIINLVSSPIGYSRSEGATKYFHQMNGLWNTVNLGLAGISLLTLGNNEVNSFNQLLNEQNSLEKLLLFNAGLDIGYIMTGVFLKERSKNTSKNPNRLLGYGNSLILQGGFLFIFDIGFYLLFHQHMTDILNISEQVSFSFYGSGLSIALKL